MSRLAIDPDTGRLCYAVGDKIYAITESRAGQFVWESGEIGNGALESFDAARVVASDYSNVVMSVYGDGELVGTYTVQDGEPFWLHESKPAYYWRVKIVASSIVMGVYLAGTKGDLYGH